MPRPSAEAEQLLNSELLQEWWAAKEREALVHIRRAQPSDDDGRRWWAQNLKIIENMRTDLNAFAKGQATAPNMAGPAGP